MHLGLEISVVTLLLMAGCESGLRAPSVVDSPPPLEPLPPPAAAPLPAPPDPPTPTATIARDDSFDAGREEAGVADASRAAALPDGGTPIANAEATIARLRPGFRACYNAGLKDDPLMQGEVTVLVHVAADGHVDESTLTRNDGLSEQVTECLRLLIASATFDAPGGKGSSLSVPVRFVQQAAPRRAAPKP